MPQVQCCRRMPPASSTLSTGMLSPLSVRRCSLSPSVPMDTIRASMVDKAPLAARKVMAQGRPVACRSSKCSRKAVDMDCGLLIIAIIKISRRQRKKGSFVPFLILDRDLLPLPQFRIPLSCPAHRELLRSYSAAEPLLNRCCSDPIRSGVATV